MKAGAAALILIALAEPAAAQFSFTQGGVRRDSIATRFKLDFAVPEAPAFSLLQVSSGSILRPGTVREFAVQVSGFVDADAGISVPKQFGFEFSPAMLLRGSRLTLNAYNSARPLYRLRLSAAVKRTASTVNQLALGLRVALVDRADLRANPEYLTDATAIATAINRIFAEQNREHPPVPGEELTADDLTPERHRKLEALARQLKQRVEERAWNADIVDVAIGALAASRDTTGEAIRLTQYAGWFTYGKGMGEWGQLLIGLRGAAVRDTVSDKFKGLASLGVRLYGGVNQYKVFVEAEGKLKSGENSALLNAGGEARIMSGGWVQFSSGIRWAKHDKATLVGNLTFKLGVLGL